MKKKIVWYYDADTRIGIERYCQLKTISDIRRNSDGCIASLYISPKSHIVCEIKMYRREKQIKTQLSPGCLASGRSDSERGDCSVAVDCYAPPLSDSVSFDFAISASIWAQSSLLRDLIASYGQRLSDHPGQLGCQGGAGCGPGGGECEC